MLRATWLIQINRASSGLSPKENQQKQRDCHSARRPDELARFAQPHQKQGLEDFLVCLISEIKLGKGPNHVTDSQISL